MTEILYELLMRDIIIPQALCIGENLQIIKGESSFFVDKLFASPNGLIIIQIDQQPKKASYQSFILFLQEFKYWSTVDLDNIASAYSKEKIGTSLSIIDMMVFDGLLEKSDSEYLYSEIDNCLRNQNFMIIFGSQGVFAGNELLSAADC